MHRIAFVNVRTLLALSYSWPWLLLFFSDRAGSASEAAADSLDPPDIFPHYEEHTTNRAAASVATTSSSSLSSSCTCSVLTRPNVWQKEHVARWMVHTLDWGIVTTISSRSIFSPSVNVKADSASMPTPFGNVYSFVDGSCDQSSGIPYFYGTYMDQTFQDMLANPRASLTLSEAALPSVCGISVVGSGTPQQGRQVQASACSISIGNYGNYGDPESPVCARLTLTGTLKVIGPTTSAHKNTNRKKDDKNNKNDDDEEYDQALKALFQRHPQMSTWPKTHNWLIAKLHIDDIWFIDFFGGASILNVTDYLAVELIPTSGSVESEDTH